MKACDQCGEIGHKQPSCSSVLCPFGPAMTQLGQVMSAGALSVDELGSVIGGWWTKYLVDTDSIQIGYDLTSWALPIKLEFGTRSLYAQVLCFDFNFWWGENL